MVSPKSGAPSLIPVNLKYKNPDKLREMVQVSSLSDCKLCAGTGWLAQDVEIFEADFGKIIPCKCLNSKIKKSLDYFSNFSLENFNTSPPNSTVRNKKSLEQAYEVAKNYVKSPEGWLTFFGPTGVGKTHLAISIFMKLKAKGQEATFVFVPDMLDELRNSYSENSTTYNDKEDYQVLGSLIYNTSFPLVKQEDKELKKQKKTRHDALNMFLI